MSLNYEIQRIIHLKLKDTCFMIIIVLGFLQGLYQRVILK